MAGFLSLKFRWGFVAAVMATLLSACVSVIADPGISVTTPHVESGAGNDAFIAADGAALPLRKWLPPEGETPRAVIVAVHGFNDYSKAFDIVPGAVGAGPYLAARGFAAYAYDQRGFGRAPHHALWPSADGLVADFTDVVRSLRARYPGLPLYAMGESMGGAVVLTALAGANPPPVDGVILVAPAIWARSTMPWYYRVALWTASHFIPGWKPTGQSLGRLASDNIAMLRDNTRDPLFIKQTRIDAVAGLVDLMSRAYKAADKQKLPVLYLYGRNDQIIPPGASAKAMADLLATDPLARGAFYDQSWHMMLRDRAGSVVLDDIAAFLKDPAKPLPSGADADAVARLRERAKQPWVDKKAVEAALAAAPPPAK